MTWWMWFAAGVGTVVAALMFAALVSRLFREPAAHRAGIDEDEDDPEPDLRDLLQPPGETKTFVVPANLWPRDMVQSTGTESLGPPPTYPETPEEHTR
jgi:hypothetical protein